jgi:hypothetical protein
MRRIIHLTRKAISVILLLGLLPLSNIGAVSGTSTVSAANYPSLMAHISHGLGCFVSTYPDTTWKQVPCGSHDLIPATVGNGNDHPAENNTTHMSWVQGDFSSVSGITKETDSYWGSNFYTLQINSQIFTCTPSGGASTQCWEQFVFRNLPGTGNPSVIFIEYWLFDYTSINNVNNCPNTAPASGWNLLWDSGEQKGDCWGDTASINLPTESPTTKLGSLTFTGTSNISSSGHDSVQICDGSNCYSQSVSDAELQLYNYWTEAEFNVFGFGTPPSGSPSTAQFNHGSSLTAEIFAQDGSANALSPSCGSGGTTGEMNNLTLGTCHRQTPPLAHIYFTDSG